MTEQQQSSQSDFAGGRIHRLPRSKFPIVIRLLARSDRRELYRVECERPTGDVGLESVYIPKMPEPATARIEYADGTIEESG